MVDLIAPGHRRYRRS